MQRHNLVVFHSHVSAVLLQMSHLHEVPGGDCLSNVAIVASIMKVPLNLFKEQSEQSGGEQSERSWWHQWHQCTRAVSPHNHNDEEDGDNNNNNIPMECHAMHTIDDNDDNKNHMMTMMLMMYQWNVVALHNTTELVPDIICALHCA